MTTDKAISEVITTLSNSFNENLYSKSQEELEQYWYFKWDDKRSIESNTYVFTRDLESYAWTCRRWEEEHNGWCCVVERVRDTYKMPKIREFLKTLAEKTSDQ
jgi:hypothetical protein